MTRYVVRRLLTSIPMLVVISFVLFAILSLAPGDPLAQFASNPTVPPEVQASLRQTLGLDQPWPVRYVKWLFAMAHGDWGFSFASRIPVGELIKQRLPNTLAVVAVAYVVGILVAVPIGIFSAVKRYTLFDHLATGFAFVGLSVPTFFTGLVLILAFSVNLHWLPFIYQSTLQVTDLDSFVAQVKQSIMPITVLALFHGGALVRYTRASMLDNLPLDYVRTARAKGLPYNRVILGHVVRNSLIPVVTLIALGAPGVISGAVITEQIFRVPGLGDLMINAIMASDTPVVMAITFTFSILVVLFNLLADVTYGLLDPRIRYD